MTDCPMCGKPMANRAKLCSECTRIRRWLVMMFAMLDSVANADEIAQEITEYGNAFTELLAVAIGKKNTNGQG